MTAAGALANTDVVVLAGGLGTRIKPVLGDVPKLLAPINNQTYLDILLAWLKRFGARRVILSLGHQASQIVDYVARHPCPGLDIDTVIEPRPLGTAGALRLVTPAVKTDVCLIMNGDSWVGADLGRFISAHDATGAAATLLCVHVDESGRYGRVEVDADAMISAFLEKQADAGPGLVNAGVYAFSRAAWDMLESLPGASLERDVFQNCPPATLAAYDAGAVPFIDIGTPESLAEAAAVIGLAAHDLGDT